ncbi:MAG: hypothetical protein II035_01130 [Firmicutes bacterium]|nr:hypothetical protein [Bacillota bacterium]
MAAMFVLMSTFFLYPSNYAVETLKDSFMSQQAIALVMAMMDVVAFLGGLCYVRIRKSAGANTHFVAPVLFLLGYLLMSFAGSAVISVAGSLTVGFANGAGIPCIIAAASHKAGKEAVSTVMPLLSASMYIAQFLSPFLTSLVTSVVGAEINHIPFFWAAILSVVLIGLASVMRRSETD